MKPTIESLISEIPGLDEKTVREHLERLGDDYFKKFTRDDIRMHIEAISTLSPSHPVEANIIQTRDNSIECTVVAYDYPSEFSLITGVLAGMGFHILSGDVYTYGRIDKKVSRGRFKKYEKLGSFTADLSNRRKIVDFFSGSLKNSVYLKNWVPEFKENLEYIISLLEKGDEEAVREAKNRVNEMVVHHLEGIASESAPVLFPVEMEVDNAAGPLTRLKVVSEDTPAFMYALSNALALHDVQIEHVRIRTIHGRVEDSIDLLDSRGYKIEDQTILDRITFSVLLTKQFTYFLAKAPDPHAALSRFEVIVKDIVKQPFREEWIKHLTDPRNLQDLARLLGASDFLWEDFIRLQYESLLPVFRTDENNRMVSESIENIPDRLVKAIEGSKNLEERKEAVNRFKDKEAFLIDLDHILNPELNFQFLAKKLTRLAELVVNTAAGSVYDDLIIRYGKPRSIAGLHVRYSIMGLGKLGGEALGYASDIELLFVFSDNGKTDGDRPIENSEFFNLLVKGIHQFIDAKREGIFQIDLRLRPHGESGPLACSVETFCRYYGREGQAHAYELLSLVRMRYIGGDPVLGRQLERIRDEMVYSSNHLDMKALRDLRERQFKEKRSAGKINAKYSPGGLVDLEYGVQTLQVMYGERSASIRTPRIHEALAALRDGEFLTHADANRLMDAYDFLRELINALRMLRGSAQDLFLPSVETSEFRHLARRMGYKIGGPFTPAQQLYLDLETHMAGVRIFAEKYFGLESLPSLETGTIVDVILSENMPHEIRNMILSKSGIKEPERAYVNLRNLAGQGGRRDTFSRMAILVWDIMKRTPDPDMALNNWERFIHSISSPEFHYNVLMSQPMQLEILLSLFSSSQFLSDTLIRNPGFFDWLMNPDLLHHTRKREDLEIELRNAADGCTGEREWLNKLRRFRRREILRIGTRDIYLGISPRLIMHELSILAEACTQVVLEQCLKRRFHDEKEEIGAPDEHFCILAFGKLGGNEINYSSDIDLLGLYSDSMDFDGEKSGKGRNKEFFTRIMEQVRSDLSSHTEEGYAYRVDLRLRPFGRSGELIQTVSGLASYYRDSASPWELQAAMKLRPIAGNLRLGYELLHELQPLIYRKWERHIITGEIDRMRKSAMRFPPHALSGGLDVKSGSGGIRDVEFTVQGLQLLHAWKNKILVEANTMLAIESLTEAAIVPEDVSMTLKEDYIFLRRIEHSLQILEDRQTHTLPEDKNEIEILAKRMLGTKANGEQFLDLLKDCLERVRNVYDRYILGRE